MVNLLEGGFQPGASFVEKAYEFAYELAEHALNQGKTDEYALASVIMLQASVLLKHSYALLAADSQRRAEREMAAAQSTLPRIHRLN